MEKLLVVIDPGHYKGYNPWALQGHYEGTEMFRMAQILQEELNSKGIKNIITRKTVEENIGLYTRGQMAVAQKGNYEKVLFLSLHDNAPGASSNSASIRGTMIFTSIYNRQLEFLKGLQNSVSSVIGCSNKEIYGMRYTDVNPNQDYYGVIRGAMNGATSQSQADREGVWCAAIIEHDFHTNLDYCKWMANDDNKRLVARSQANYIANYFKITTATVSSAYTNEVCNGTLTVTYKGSDGLNLHNDANLNTSSIAGVLKYGERRRVVGISTLSNNTKLYRLEDGHFITSDTNFVNYITNGYVSFVGRVNSGDGLNVRDFPNVGGAKIFVLGNNNLVDVIGEAYNNGTKWYYIHIKNTTVDLKGYVNASYIVRA